MLRRDHHRHRPELVIAFPGGRGTVDMAQAGAGYGVSDGEGRIVSRINRGQLPGIFSDPFLSPNAMKSLGPSLGGA